LLDAVDAVDVVRFIGTDTSLSMQKSEASKDKYGDYLLTPQTN